MTRMAAVALLLLLLNSLQEVKADDSTKSVSDDLKQLRDIVYQQGTALVELKTEMKYIEKENAVLKTKLAKQTKQSRSAMENLKKELSAQADNVSSTKTQLAASKTEVENLKEENAEIKSKVENLNKAKAELKTEVSTLKKENAALKGGLSTNEGDIENLQNLKKEVAEHPKVAFSATLTSTVGPSARDITVVFRNVVTNVGGAYNPDTGIFTAPFRGVYYVRFTICSPDSVNPRFYLYKNKNYITYMYSYNYNNYKRFISGGFTLELEKGDIIYISLPGYMTLYDSGYKQNMFSGFMLFDL